MKNTILVLTNSKEIAAERVIQHLRDMGQLVLVVRTDQLFGEKVSVRSSSNVDQIIRLGEEIDLERIKSVWYRRPELPEIPEDHSDTSRDFIRNEYRSFFWSLYTNIEAFWMNPPLVVRLLEHNKLYQMKEAARVGLRVPATAISNDVDELLRFCDLHNKKVAIKTLYPALIGPGTATSQYVFTNIVSRVDIEQYGDDIGLAPVFLQEYIEKKLELRVTVVGKRVFACAIYSQDSERTRHDWRRYDFDKVAHKAWFLPEAVKEKLIAFMESLGLTYGAIDMILTPEGEYVFLEVNPNGQWEWIEELTKMPISRAIAELLANPPKQN